jgi:hypothetical protein
LLQPAASKREAQNKEELSAVDSFIGEKRSFHPIGCELSPNYKKNGLSLRQATVIDTEATNLVGRFMEKKRPHEAKS